MKISVITVSLNNAETIRDTIESVSAQHYETVEHIIVDGNSGDGTVEVIKEYSDRIAHWISEPDKSMYEGMNKGLEMANGDLVGFLNADDVYEDNDVLKSIAQQFSDPSIDACYGDLIYVNPDDLTRVVRYWKSSPFRKGLFARGWNPPHPTFYTRKNVYDKFGGYDLGYKIGNDVELMMRFLERYNVKSVYVPKVLVKMRTGGISNKSFNNILNQNKEVIRAARNNNIPLNSFLFILFKIGSRLKQYTAKPKIATV